MGGIKGLPGWFTGAEYGPCPPGRPERSGLVEKNLSAAASFTKALVEGEMYAARRGLAQGLEARSRMAGFLLLVAAAAMADTTAVLGAGLVLVLALAALSSVGPAALGRRVAPAFVFTLVLACPVFTGFITPGRVVAGFTAWGVEVAITEEGLRTGLFFLLRVTVMVSLVSLLFLTTRQRDFFRGLGGLPVPAVFVTTLFMTFRYLLILVKLFEDAQLARRSRTVDGRAGEKRWFASRAAMLLRRSVHMADDVALAMTARGFNGRVRTLAADPPAARDVLWTGFATFVFLLVVLFR